MTVSIEVRAVRPACQSARSSLRDYVRAGLPNAAAHRVSAHLECCRDCSAAYLDLVEGRRGPRGRRGRSTRSGNGRWSRAW
jgi:anti-sigma factor RsiW